MNQNSSNQQQRHRVRITEVRTTLVDMTDAELEQANDLTNGRWSHSHDKATGAFIVHHIQLVTIPELPGADLPWKLQEPA